MADAAFRVGGGGRGGGGGGGGKGQRQIFVNAIMSHAYCKMTTNISGTINKADKQRNSRHS